MIQLYYIATPERENRFRSIFDQLDVVDTFFPVVSIPSLTAFVSRDKAINQQDFILCDLGSATWSNEHILSAVQQLRRFSVVKMVFLAPPSDHTTTLFKFLADLRVDGLITDNEDPSSTLSAILQGDSGYMRRLAAIQEAVVMAADREVTPLHIPPGLVLDVAVAGSMPRVGTTTQAFALYHFLSRVGFHPAILDQGQSALRAVLELYWQQTVTRKDHVEVKGICIVTDRSPAFNAYISDYGVLSAEWVKPFCGADLSVLVGGVKPWELSALATNHAAVKQEGPRELVTLLSFAGPEDTETVRQYLSPCAAVSYHPDIWMPGSDTVYRETVLPCLKKVCGQA